jgi:hypothetical protein
MAERQVAALPKERSGSDWKQTVRNVAEDVGRMADISAPMRMLQKKAQARTSGAKRKNARP